MSAAVVRQDDRRRTQAHGHARVFDGHDALRYDREVGHVAQGVIELPCKGGYSLRARRQCKACSADPGAVGGGVDGPDDGLFAGGFGAVEDGLGEGEVGLGVELLEHGLVG